LAIDLGYVAKRRVEVEKRIGILSRADQRERARAAVLVAISEGSLEWSQLREFERSHANDQGIFQARIDGFPLNDRLVEVSRSDIEQRLDQPVDAGPLDGEGLELMRFSGQTRVVRTLREYREAIAEGYFAGTTFTMNMEALYFRRPLVLLELVAVANYPEVSHMASPWLSLCDIDRLPATLLFVTEEMTSDEAFAGQRDALKGLTIQDLVDRGEAQIQSVSSQHLRVDYAGGTTFLVELMRADTNNDGVEELVLHRGGGPQRGTYRSAMVMALAVRAAGENFVEVPMMAESTDNPTSNTYTDMP
jgi:hypothetical protein